MKSLNIFIISDQITQNNLQLQVISHFEVILWLLVLVESSTQTVVHHYRSYKDILLIATIANEPAERLPKASEAAEHRAVQGIVSILKKMSRM